MSKRSICANRNIIDSKSLLLIPIAIFRTIQVACTLGTFLVACTANVGPVNDAMAIDSGARDSSNSSETGIIYDSNPPRDRSMTDGSQISIMVNPSFSHLAPGATEAFTALVNGSANAPVDWSIQEGAAGGSITATGSYTAPSAPGTYHVVATSHADATVSASATVTVATVGACSHLPASGTWDSIGPPLGQPTPDGHGYANAIVVDPFDPSTVWLGTGYAGLFKSTDCGATWTHINTGRNGTSVDDGALGSIAIDPSTRGVMYTTAFQGSNGLWKSTNGGVDWDQLFPPESELAHVVDSTLVNSIAMDAHDPRHLVASMHSNCRGAYGAVCEAESTDAGATWRLFTVAPSAGWASWVPGAGAFILDASTWLFGSYSNGLWLTTDHGATWENVTPTGATGATGGKTINQLFLPASDGSFYLASMEGILRSSDGRRWSLIHNSGGRTVGFAMGGGQLYSSDQWSVTYHHASDTDPTVWTQLPSPQIPAIPNFGDQGAPFLFYDPHFRVLYSSNWAGGAWRFVMP